MDKIKSSLPQKGKTVLCIGDSITDCGRSYPFGHKNGLGNGYVSLMQAICDASYPQARMRFLNLGISGNRINDLEERWDRDVLAYKPDWVSVKIGVNDVWRQFDEPFNLVQILPYEFRNIYQRLIDKTLPHVQGMLLVTPFFVELNREDAMRQRVECYAQIVRELARENQIALADTQTEFDRYLQHNPSQTLCGDRVHPNLSGHMLIAYACLKALGIPMAN